MTGYNKNICFKNVTLTNGDQVHLAVVNGKVAINPKPDSFIGETVEAKGLIAIPGLIDMQVHVRTPGQTYKEDVHSATESAIRGGFTRIACMPNTKPTLDCAKEILNLRKIISTDALCPIDIIPAMTLGIAGHEIANFHHYKDLGIYGITDDGRGLQDDAVMEHVFKLAKDFGLSILQHCEVESISQHAPLHEGVTSRLWQMKGQTAEAEYAMVARDLNLLAKYGGHYHVLHASSRRSVEMVIEAKRAGLNATIEVTPHHLLLSEEDLPKTRDANFKMNPPLRSKEDQEFLVESFLSGKIDIVTTDHAPHSEEEKSVGFETAPFGIIGLETAFPLLYTHFVKNKKMTLSELVYRMSLRVSELFPIPSNEIIENETANFSIVNVEDSFDLLPEVCRSKSRNSPFWHQRLTGQSMYTVVSGCTHQFSDRFNVR
ncbi:MAG: dihydroorotase [Bacteriovoracaceae bacterium]|nr:dihydroorotase [Bacteriovoracaceae bacterium]